MAEELPTTASEKGNDGASSGLVLISVAKTDVGKERSVNEDATYRCDQRRVYLLCDGMGGHASGQLASRTAIDTMAKALTKPPGGRKGVREPLLNAIKKANKAIRNYSSRHPHCHGMGTTVVALRVASQEAHICHVGDSRAYCFRARHLTLLTRDHSLKNLYEDKPELTGRLGPATSNVIVRAVGLESSVAVERQKQTAQEGDLFLLCSDGLTDLVDDKTIEAILGSGGSLDDMATSLIAKANEGGGTDNISVILVAVATEASREFGPRGTRVGH